MSTQNALEQIIEQVPSVDQYGLELLKKKVDFLKEVQSDIPPRWTDSTQVGSTSDSPVFDQVGGREVVESQLYETGVDHTFEAN